MKNLKSNRFPNRAAIIAERAVSAVERFLHIEAMSGLVLIIAAAAALVIANSSYASLYTQFWHMPFGIQIGAFSFFRDLHFWVNDGLMTVFFLVAGMEIRREIHEGALSDLKQATLPIIAAIGGVCLPALIYLFLNVDGMRAHGWAVPTATDIAFAVGILALLGKAIPANLRVILLSLAIIDDIIAVLIIAVFYSNGLEFHGAAIAVFGIVVVFFFQWIGIASAWFYILPAAIIWWGLMVLGAHPSLAGVILGMITPVLVPRHRLSPLARISSALETLQNVQQHNSPRHITAALKELRQGQRDIIQPVTRVQMALHPWVAFVIMPIFAFANAGVSFSGFDLFADGAAWIVSGVAVGLFIGKPVGILLASFIAVKTGLCRLPPNVTWSGLLLAGFLAGIGFTMAIFVAMLAFNDVNQLNAAKIGVLGGSGLSALAGLAYGLVYLQMEKRKNTLS